MGALCSLLLQSYSVHILYVNQVIIRRYGLYVQYEHAWLLNRCYVRTCSYKIVNESLTVYVSY